MANANLVELETCMQECIEYCEAHPHMDVVQLYHQTLCATQRNYNECLKTSDVYHLKWRQEQLESRVVWKHLAAELREAQNRLRRMGAIDYPCKRILYWDEELLLQHINAMIAYLLEHTEDIEWAQECIGKCERLVDATKTEGRESQDMFKSFQRFVDLRREAINQAGAIIGEFRSALRRSVGKKDLGYTSIFWPYAIESDENVLF